MEKQRVLGLDFGSKTVGVAVSDLLMATAQGVEIIRRDRPSKLRKTLARIETLVKEFDIRSIVLGYPFHLNASEGSRCEETKDFADRLIKRLDLPVYLVDERLSTNASHRVMSDLCIKGEEKKAVVDEIAAMWILQTYLDGISLGTVYTPYRPE